MFLITETSLHPQERGLKKIVPTLRASSGLCVHVHTVCTEYTCAHTCKHTCEHTSTEKTTSAGTCLVCKLLSRHISGVDSLVFSFFVLSVLVLTMKPQLGLRGEKSIK